MEVKFEQWTLNFLVLSEVSVYMHLNIKIQKQVSIHLNTLQNLHFLTSDTHIQRQGDQTVAMKLVQM